MTAMGKAVEAGSAVSRSRLVNRRIDFRTYLIFPASCRSREASRISPFKKRMNRVRIVEKQDGLLLAAVSAVLSSLFVSAVLHSPGNSPSLYSDLLDSFWGRCWVQNGALPYIGSSPGCSTSFEYPVLSGFLLYFVKLVGVTLWGYYETFTALSLMAGVAMACACYGIARRFGRNLNPLYFVMPTFLVYGIYNFDLFHALLAIVSVFFFVRGNRSLSASFLGLAVDLKLTSVVLLPIFLMELTTTKDRMKYLAWFAALVAVFNLPIVLLNFGNFLAGYQFIGNWGLEDAWYVWIFQNPATWDYAKLFALGVAGLLLVRVYTLEASLLSKSFLAIAVYLLATYIYAPQFNLLLIPFIVVLDMKHPALYPWDSFNALIILTWFIPNSSPTLPWNWPQVFALLRAVCLALMCISVASAEGHSLVSWLRHPFGKKTPPPDGPAPEAPTPEPVPQDVPEPVAPDSPVIGAPNAL